MRLDVTRNVMTLTSLPLPSLLLHPTIKPLPSTKTHMDPNPTFLVSRFIFLPTISTLTAVQ